MMSQSFVRFALSAVPEYASTQIENQFVVWYFYGQESFLRFR